MSPLHPSEVFEVSGPLDHDLEIPRSRRVWGILQGYFFMFQCVVTLIRANNNLMVEPLRKWPLRIRKYLKSYSLRFAKVDLVEVSKAFVYPPMFRRILSVLRGTVYTSLEHGQDWPKLLIINITRVGTLIVATIYLQLIQNRYMFRSFTVLQCSHQHCVQPVASDVEVVGYL